MSDEQSALSSGSVYDLHRQRTARRQRDELRAQQRRRRQSRDFHGEPPPHGFTSDGCTCAPDFAWNGADLREACRWHDWHYNVGGNERDRKQADRDFLHNLKASGCPWLQRRFYYNRVRFWGTRQFGYANGSKPPAVRHRLAILINRYRE